MTVFYCHNPIDKGGEESSTVGGYFTTRPIMAYEPIGEQTGDRPKTPTLRQYLKLSGKKIPNHTNVTTIFRPGKYGGWSLVCDGRFRVEIQEDNPLYKMLTEQIGKLELSCTTLTVSVTDAEKVQWALNIDTDSASEWSEYSWGYTLKVMTAKTKKPTAEKASR